MNDIVIEKLSVGTRLLGLGSQRGDQTIGVYLLNDATAPDTYTVAQAPAGTIWINPLPVVGGPAFYQKAEDSTLLKSANLTAA